MNKMKIVFELSAEQEARMQEMLARSARYIGTVDNYVLTYEGSREHFLMLMDTVYNYVFDLTDGKRPMPKYYEPDDKRLYWHESYSDYLWNRSPWSYFKDNYTECKIPDRFVAQKRINDLINDQKSLEGEDEEFIGDIYRFRLRFEECT